VVPKASRPKLPNTIDVTERGYARRTIIRNLTDGQTEASRADGSPRELAGVRGQGWVKGRSYQAGRPVSVGKV
jgi:hypothetical protein